MDEEMSALERKLREGRSKIDSIELAFSILEFRYELVKPTTYLPQSLLSMEESAAVYKFLSKYIVAIVRDFVESSVDYDIILAAYGFLDGYEHPRVHARHVQYCQNVGIHEKTKDIPLNEYWSKNIHKNLNAKENAIIKKLAKKLEVEMAKRGGTLGYAAEAEKLIEKPFPSPNYLLGKGYRKCEIQDKVFYVPLTRKDFSNESQDIGSSEVKVQPDGNGVKPVVIGEPPTGETQLKDDRSKKLNIGMHIISDIKTIVDSIYSSLLHAPLQTIIRLLSIILLIIVIRVGWLCNKILSPFIDNNNASINATSSSLSEQANDIEFDKTIISNKDVPEP